MPRYSPSDTIVITLPNTSAVREALLMLGGRGVDDDAGFWEDISELAALRRANVTLLRPDPRTEDLDSGPISKLTPETCEEKADAYRLINDAILRALGLGQD